jgi:hypothetical protein
MKRVLPLILVILGLVACDRQGDGYLHSSKEFTELDKKAVARVRGIALGKPELLNSIAAEYTDEELPELDPCGYTDYEVHKVTRRDLNKIQGHYPEEIQVFCTTSTKESGLLRFEWVFDTNLERIREFKFGFDPSEFEPDE